MKAKTFLTGLVLAALAVPTFAQTETTEISEYLVTEKKFYQESLNSSIKNNWFISAMGGGQMYFGDHDKQCNFKERVSEAASIYVGLRLNPFFSTRFGYSGLVARGATKRCGDPEYGDPHGTGELISGDREHHKLQYQKFRYGDVHGDVLFDLTNLIGGYNPKRIYSLDFYVGVGYAWTYDKPRGQSVSGRLGIINTFAISRKWDILIDISGTLLNDDFDGEKGERWGEGLLTAQVGLAYTFVGRKKTTYHMGDKLNFATEMSELTKQNTRLNETLAKAQQEKNDALKAKLAAEKLVKENATKTIVRNIGTASNLVTFQIGKADLSNEARAHLNLLSDAIKKGDANTVYMITGYADAGTGTTEFNEQLSKERAQNVYDCLINEFGIKESQLRTNYKGGVENMYYEDPAISRSAIILPVE